MASEAKPKRKLAALLDPSELLDGVEAPHPRPSTLIAEPTRTEPTSLLDRNRTVAERPESMMDFPPAETHATWVRGPADWGIGMPEHVPVKVEPTPVEPAAVARAPEAVSISDRPTIAKPTQKRTRRTARLMVGVGAAVIVGIGLSVLLATPMQQSGTHAEEPLAPQLFAKGARVSPSISTTPGAIREVRERPARVAVERKDPASLRPEVVVASKADRAPWPRLAAAMSSRGLDLDDLESLLPEARTAIDEVTREHKVLSSELDVSFAERLKTAPISRRVAEAHLARVVEALRRSALPAERLEAIEARYFELAHQLAQTEPARILEGANRLLVELAGP